MFGEHEPLSGGGGGCEKGQGYQVSQARFMFFIIERTLKRQSAQLNLNLNDIF